MFPNTKSMTVDLNDPYYTRTYVGARRARIADVPEGN